MTYNVTAIKTAQTTYELVTAANDATGGVFFNFMTIAIFIILLLVMKRYSFESAFLSASWMSFILSSFLAFSNLISLYLPIVFGVLSAVAALYVWTRGD